MLHLFGTAILLVDIPNSFCFFSGVLPSPAAAIYSPGIMLCTARYKHMKSRESYCLSSAGDLQARF